MRVVETACGHVRRHGYHAGAAAELTAELAAHRATPMSDRLAAKLIDAVTEQSLAAREGERLVGSSECLESLIGKGKRLEQQQSQSGFTKMILGLAAAVVQPTQQYVNQALTHVRHLDVQTWCREHLGTTLQAQRRQALGNPGTNLG